MVTRQLRFEADEFTGSDPLSKVFEITASTPPILVRCVNELDAQANAAIYLTDAFDDEGDYEVLANEVTMLGGDGTPENGNGQAEGDLLSEPWERIRVEVTPATAPTSGYLDVRTSGGGR